MFVHSASSYLILLYQGGGMGAPAVAADHGGVKTLSDAVIDLEYQQNQYVQYDEWMLVWGVGISMIVPGYFCFEVGEVSGAGFREEQIGCLP